MKQSRKNSLRERLIPLGWKILEYKLFYYYPDLVHNSWWNKLTVDDLVYDELEKEYLRLSFALKYPNYNVHKIYFKWQNEEFQKYSKIELDFVRPSVQLVAAKLGQPMKSSEIEWTEERLTWWVEGARAGLQYHTGHGPVMCPRATGKKKMQIKEKEMTEEKVKLRTIQGGKSNPPGNNWLMELPKGTSFSCSNQNSKSYILELYVIAFKFSKTVVLVNGFNPEHRHAVDSRLFSQQYILTEILGFEDGSNELQPRRVANDVDAPEGQSANEGE